MLNEVFVCARAAAVVNGYARSKM